jgi:hypothetical protein
LTFYGAVFCQIKSDPRSTTRIGKNDGKKIMAGILGRCCSFLFSILIIVSPIATLASTADRHRLKSLSPMKSVQVPFIANKGQMDERVAFSALTLGGTLFVTRDADLVYAFAEAAGKNNRIIGTGTLCLTLLKDTCNTRQKI